MNEVRDIAVKYVHRLSASDYTKLLNVADEIERLRAALERIRQEYPYEDGAEIAREALKDD